MTPTSGIDPFYLIVPDVASVRRFAQLGVRTIQLRYKPSSPRSIRQEIVSAMEAVMSTSCQLIINDHWREALSVGCDYVHLGQEDLAEADLPTLKAAGVRIGLSTHDEAELAIALAADPDYVALGPIFPTSTKSTGRAVQGVAKLATWRAKIANLPLVAIGGITLETAADVFAAGAQSCAVVSDVLGAPDPEGRARDWLAVKDR
jgi:thiamine-phosphate pyrophosphorylase